MRLVIVLWAALFLTSSIAVWAEEYVLETTESFEICEDLSLIARDAMAARQANKPLSEALKQTLAQMLEMYEESAGGVDPEDLEDIGSELEDAASEIVLLAYDVSIRSSDGLRAETITEFENNTFRGCYEEMRSESDE